jgi:hypothetical protein
MFLRKFVELMFLKLIKTLMTVLQLEDATLRVATQGAGSMDQKKELDDMLSSLGVAPVSDVLSSLSSLSSIPDNGHAGSTPENSMQSNALSAAQLKVAR